MNNLNTINLFDNTNVIVYKNMFKNINLIMDTIKKSEQSEEPGPIFGEWEGWFHFGSQVGFPYNPDLTKDEMYQFELVHEYREINENEDFQDYVSKILSNVFYVTTKDYINKNNIEFPNWQKMGLTICKYNRDGKDYAMAYHTDYGKSKENAPGFQFGITVCMYLNDDYIGGELNLLDMDTKQVIQYTPHAGDVVIFPSGLPILHGVGKIYEGDKYFCRLFWGWDSAGTEEWHQNQEKYGKEVWAKMETERIKKEFWYGKHHYDVVWDEDDLNLPKYNFSEENPRITPIYSPYPIIKRGKGNE